MFERAGAALGWQQSFTGLLGEGLRPVPVVVWELHAMEIEYWGLRRERMPGALPAAYLILSELGRLVAAVGCGGGSEARANEALFRGHFPATAQYRIDNGRLITRAPNGAGGAESVRSRECRLEDRWLEVATAWFLGDDGVSEIRRAVFGFRRME